MDLKSPNALRFAFAETYTKNMNVFAPESIVGTDQTKISSGKDHFRNGLQG